MAMDLQQRTASHKHSDWNMSFPNFQITPDFYNNDAAIGTLSRVSYICYSSDMLGGNSFQSGVRTFRIMKNVCVTH